MAKKACAYCGKPITYNIDNHRWETSGGGYHCFYAPKHRHEAQL